MADLRFPHSHSPITGPWQNMTKTKATEQMRDEDIMDGILWTRRDARVTRRGERTRRDRDEINKNIDIINITECIVDNGLYIYNK